MVVVDPDAPPELVTTRASLTAGGQERPAGTGRVRVRAAGLRRGAYRVRLTVAPAGGPGERAALTARRL